MNNEVLGITGEPILLKEHHIHMVILLVWFLFPVISIALICLFLYYVKLNNATIKYYFLLLALVPAFINYTKVPVTDLDTYYTEYTYFANHGISSVLENSVLDPFFYYVTFLLAKCTGGYQPVFALFWTTFIYFTLFNAQFEFNKLFEPYKKATVIALIFFTVFIGLEFGLTGHVVRQCAALSLIMLGIAKLCLEKKSYKLFFILAFLTHFSTIVFLPLLIFPLLKKRTSMLWMVILGFLFFLIGNSNLLEVLNLFNINTNVEAVSTILDRAEDYAGRDDGNVTLRMLLEVVFYFVVCVYFLVKKQDMTTNGNKINKFVVLFIFFSLFALLIRNNSLLLLRYFFYFYFLSTFVALIVLKSRNYLGLLFLILIVSTAPFRFFNGLRKSDFVYINNSYNLLLVNVPQFLLH